MNADERYAELRLRMIESQLRSRDIDDPRVLDAMNRVPREAFVLDEDRSAAYDDHAMSIGHAQTISQPYTVAFMCQAAQLTGDEKVLEIGTGSGYGAAVLSLLSREVYTVERIPELTEQARRRLEAMGYDNVHVATADGTLGFPAGAPFDAIVVTAGADVLPEALVKQLAPGGRIVIPIGEYGGGQTMYRFTKRDGELTAEDLGAFSFVPLIGAYTRDG